MVLLFAILSQPLHWEQIKESEDIAISIEDSSIPFKQLIFDYIYTNDAINSRKIALIKCDIEDGEENLLEDLLHFAYYNKCKAQISFHLDQWKSKKIADFAYLFDYFHTNCHPTQHPSGPIIFTPIYGIRTLVKKNITALIIGYNQLTYIRDMVQQLEKYTSDIVIVDNASDFEPLLDYYRNSYKYALLRQPTNRGHTVFQDPFIQKLMGDVYILTDPDLKFNQNLPQDFIQSLLEVSNAFRAHKVGFALCIHANNLRKDIGPARVSFESQYWKRRVTLPTRPDLILYSAPIDTTFCLINNRYRGTHVRVAGDFTCIHRPWHENFQYELAPGEFDSYLKNNISTHDFFKLQD